LEANLMKEPMSAFFLQLIEVDCVFLTRT
jgi:hypothetical protein